MTKDIGNVFTLIWWNQHWALDEGLPIPSLALTMESVWSVVGSCCDARVSLPKMDGYNKVSLTWEPHFNQRGSSSPWTDSTCAFLREASLMPVPGSSPLTVSPTQSCLYICKWPESILLCFFLEKLCPKEYMFSFCLQYTKLQKNLSGLKSHYLW